MIRWADWTSRVTGTAGGGQDHMHYFSQTLRQTYTHACTRHTHAGTHKRTHTCTHRHKVSVAGSFEEPLSGLERGGWGAVGWVKRFPPNRPIRSWGRTGPARWASSPRPPGPTCGRPWSASAWRCGTLPPPPWRRGTSWAWTPWSSVWMTTGVGRGAKQMSR